MVFYFAHNGVDHGTTAEAVTHSINPLFAVVAVGAVVVIIGAVLLARKNNSTDEESEDD